MFVDRRKRGRDRYLSWKTGALAVGGGLALFGVRLEQPWLIWSAIAVILLGFLLRFAPRLKRDAEEEQRR